jgi:hypothetical protein
MLLIGMSRLGSVSLIVMLLIGMSRLGSVSLIVMLLIGIGGPVMFDG